MSALAKLKHDSPQVLCHHGNNGQKNKKKHGKAVFHWCYALSFVLAIGSSFREPPVLLTLTVCAQATHTTHHHPRRFHQIPLLPVGVLKHGSAPPAEAAAASSGSVPARPAVDKLNSSGGLWEQSQTYFCEALKITVPSKYQRHLVMVVVLCS